MSKKKANPEKIVDHLAKMVWEHLNTLPEEEQERRLTAAEGRVANASHAGSRRTSSLTRRTGPVPGFSSRSIRTR